MSKKIIILKQDKPTEQIYAISGPTQIGRTDKNDWAIQERDMPQQFNQLEAVITVLNSSHISRNHAGIYNDENGNFYLIDLNSKNGTFLNGQNINPNRSKPKPHKLTKDDKILISADLELKVTGFKDTDYNNYALMVGCDGGNLKGVKEDLTQISQQLIKRGYAGNITQLYNGNATKENIIKQLEKLTYLTTPDSHFIFHYSGHGNKSGLNVKESVLTPIEFYQRLSNIRGKKAVILDSCHAGVFINDSMRSWIPDGTLVLAGSSEKGLAYEKPNNLLANGKHMGSFSAALVEYLISNREKLNLKVFEDKIEAIFGKDQFKLHYQQPRITGSSFTVMVANSISLFIEGGLAQYLEPDKKD